MTKAPVPCPSKAASATRQGPSITHWALHSAIAAQGRAGLHLDGASAAEGLGSVDRIAHQQGTAADGGGAAVGVVANQQGDA